MHRINHVLSVALLVALGSFSGLAFCQDDEAPSLLPKGKFEGVDLDPSALVGKPDDTQGDVNQRATPDDYSSELAPANAAAGLPSDVVDAVWKLIDRDQNQMATDREALAAVKLLRVEVNSTSKSPNALRDVVRTHANTDDDPTVTATEAMWLIAQVRGARCPTAARMKNFFDHLDTSGNQSLEGEEVRAAFVPLGAVGRYLLGQLGPQLKALDVDDDDSINLREAYFSANALLRIQLATEGVHAANQTPRDWLRFVTAVAYLDVDADNKVSRLEASDLRGVASAFGQIDTNRDQYISVSELCRFQQRLDLTATSGG